MSLGMSRDSYGHLATRSTLAGVSFHEKCRQLSGAVAALPFSTMERPDAVNRALVEWMTG